MRRTCTDPCCACWPLCRCLARPVYQLPTSSARRPLPTPLSPGAHRSRSTTSTPRWPPLACVYAIWTGRAPFMAQAQVSGRHPRARVLTLPAPAACDAGGADNRTRASLSVRRGRARPPPPRSPAAADVVAAQSQRDTGRVCRRRAHTSRCQRRLGPRRRAPAAPVLPRAPAVTARQAYGRSQRGAALAFLRAPRPTLDRYGDATYANTYNGTDVSLVGPAAPLPFGSLPPPPPSRVANEGCRSTH